MGPLIVVVAALGALLLFFATKAGGATVKEPVPKGTGGNTLDGIINSNAARYGVEVALLKAVIRTESNFNAGAVNPASSGNAFTSYGLMQITPILGQEYGIVKEYQNVTEPEISMLMQPETNVRIGAWYLGRLLSKYPFDAAIQMYNLGETGYNSGRRNEDYLTKVKRYYNEYKPD